MDHYIDLRVRPDPEFPVPQLLNALAAKLHRALVALGSEDVGISFPRHRPNGGGLGDILRLHGSAERLQLLMATGWLGGMGDHVFAPQLRPVPPGASHRVVRRVQVQSSAERIRRRQMRRHGWTEEEARRRVPDSASRCLDLPWLHLRSASTGQPFRLFVDHGPVQPSQVAGRFNAYGLSSTATVPWF